MFAVPTDMHGGLAFVIMLGLVALALGIVPLLWRWRDRRRGARIAQRLGREGFAVDTRPSREKRRAVLERLGDVALLPPNPEQLSWVATKPGDDGEMLVLRQSRRAPGVRYWDDASSIVVAIPGAASGPEVWLSRSHIVAERPDHTTNARPELRFGDGWFDRHFRIQGQDADALTRLLTPGVREHIASGPSEESWTIAGGHVVCVFGADTSVAGIGVMIERTRRLLALLDADAS